MSVGYILYVKRKKKRIQLVIHARNLELYNKSNKAILQRVSHSDTHTQIDINLTSKHVVEKKILKILV